MTKVKAPGAKKVGGWPKGKPRGPKPEADRINSAPKNPARFKTTTTDWVAVRNAYVRGIAPNEGEPAQFLGLVELAGRLGVSERAIAAHSGEENWPEQRENFRNELQSREDKQLLERLATQNVRARMAYFSTALRGQQAIDRKLRNDEVSDMALQRLMGALRSSQQVADVAQGRPADGPANVQNNFWVAFTGAPVAPVRDAFRDLDAEAIPSVGVVAAPPRP